MENAFDPTVIGKQGGKATRTEQHWQGTSVIGELLTQIRAAGRPLTPVFRTDSRMFSGVTVPFVWVRGKWAWQGDDDLGRSSLWVDFPDEIYRQVQSQYAEWMMRRWFGRLEVVDLLAPLRTDAADRPLTMHLEQRLGSGDWERVVVTDWEQLLIAMAMSDRLGSHVMGPAKLSLFMTPEIPARVVQDRLEINIQPAVPLMQRAWAQTLREQVLEA